MLKWLDRNTIWFVVAALLWLTVMATLIILDNRNDPEHLPATLLKSYEYDNKRIDLIQLDEGRCLIYRGIGQGGIDCEWARE